LPDRDRLAVARGEVRTLAIRSDDFRELCDDDAELAEALLEGLGAELASHPRLPAWGTSQLVVNRDPQTATVRTVLPINGDAVPTPVDDGSGAGVVAAPQPDEPEEPEIEMITEPEPAVVAAIVAAAQPVQKTRPFGSRGSSERLILKHEERAAAAADLEEALTKLTLESDPAQGEQDPEPDASFDHSEPEISIEAANDGPHQDPEPPRPDEPGEEPEEMVMTVQDEPARIVEVEQDDPSQTLTLTVEE
jgi:hypothetical protein